MSFEFGVFVGFSAFGLLVFIGLAIAEMCGEHIDEWTIPTETTTITGDKEQ